MNELLQTTQQQKKLDWGCCCTCSVATRGFGGERFEPFRRGGMIRCTSKIKRRERWDGESLTLFSDFLIQSEVQSGVPNELSSFQSSPKKTLARLILLLKMKLLCFLLSTASVLCSRPTFIADPGFDSQEVSNLGSNPVDPWSSGHATNLAGDAE
jgi:hypothetical protein